MDTEFFKELERFALLVKKRVSTTYAGGRKSLRYGRGITPVTSSWLTGRPTAEPRSCTFESMRRNEA